MDVVAIGTSSFVPGFGLAGCKTILANGETVLARIDECRHAAIVVVEGALLDRVEYEDRERLRASVSPVVLTLSPGGERETQELRKMIKNTLGVDLLK